MLSFVSPEGPGKILAMGYGVFSSFALPLETVMIPLVVTELFGSVSFAKLLGIYVSVNTAGFAIGNPIANLVFDLCGTYFPLPAGVGGDDAGSVRSIPNASRKN